MDSKIMVDGNFFLYDVQEAMRIRTGEKGRLFYNFLFGGIVVKYL
ncbi:MAG: hypothetical protein ABIG31_02240 [Candidatus Omnitrophota bacterium]